MAKTSTFTIAIAAAAAGGAKLVHTDLTLDGAREILEKHPDALLFAGSPIPWARTIQIGEPRNRASKPAADRSCPSARVLLTASQRARGAVECPKCQRVFHPRIGKDADAATIRAHAPEVK